MVLEMIEVTVNGKAFCLPRGAEVRHALNWVGGAALVRQVANGQAVIWDETAGAPTDLGGAIYAGQKLVIRQS